MDVISIIFSVLASIMIVITGVFVFFKDWREQFSRYYLFYTMGGFGILSTMFLMYIDPSNPNLTQLNRITQMSTMMFFSSVLTLSLVFPKSSKKFPFKYTILIISPAILIGFLIVFTDISITRAYFEDGVLKRDFNRVFGAIDFYNIYAFVAGIYLITGTIIFIIKYFKTRIYVYKLQMRYVFVGASFGIIAAAVCSILLPKFFNYSRLYVIGPALAALFTTFSLFYSVIAYNLMDIKTAIHKTTMYMIISMIIFLPIFGIIHMHYNKIFFMDTLPIFFVVIMIVVIYILFVVYVQPFIDRLFKRKQYEFENILDDFIRNVAEVRDLNKIIQMIVDNLHGSLYLKNAFFLLYNDEERKYELAYHRGRKGKFEFIPLERNSPIIRWFVRHQELLTLNRIYTDDKYFNDLRYEFSEFYSDYNLQLVLPIYHDRRLLGLICLGEKDSLSGFSPDEIEKLRYFQNKSNDFISTALTYQKAMKEQFIARTIDLSSAILEKSVPDVLPNLNSIKFGAFVIPKYHDGGGDYFDFIRPGNHGIGIFASDISGVGINSALNSVIIRSSFQSNLKEAPSTFTVMQNINKVLYDFSDGKGGLITAYYMYYDVKSMKLMYTNAGYPALELFRVEKNNFDSLDTEGIPLGYDDKASYGIGRTNLLRGDIGVLYSKTLVNSKNTRGDVFGLSKVRRIVNDNRSKHPSEIAVLIQQNFVEFMGVSSPESDILVLLFKIV